MYQIKQEKKKNRFLVHTQKIVLKTSFNMEDKNLKLLFEPQNQFIQFKKPVFNRWTKPVIKF